MRTGVTMKVGKLIFIGVFILALTSAASAQVLQPLADGFPKRAITLVVADDPGSRDGIYARAVQQALKGISPVPIMVSDEPATTFGTFFKLKDLQLRPGGKEGYYPLAVTVWGSMGDLHCEPIKEELGLDVTDMNMVIVSDQIPYTFTQKKNAPWGATFADFVKYAKANPGKARYISNQVGSGNDCAGEWVMQTLGLKVQKIPQQSSQSAVAVVAAGEGDFTWVSADYALPHYNAGKVDMMMFIASEVPPPWNKDPKVVASKEAGLPAVPMGIIVGQAVNKDVPPAHVEWLYKLFKAAAETDVYKQREKMFPGLRISLLNPAEANALKMKMYDYAGGVIRNLGLAYDQQKK